MGSLPKEVLAGIAGGVVLGSVFGYVLSRASTDESALVKGNIVHKTTSISASPMDK